jgi:DNA-binding Lrp family transcriptional regulator
MNDLDSLAFRLLNDWQRDLPLRSRPYAELATHLGIGEAEVLARFAELKSRGHVSRIGAVFRPHVLGYSTLAAVACPEERLEVVADLIDGYAEVNHNYEREHAYNLWFVVTAPDAARVGAVLAEIERASGLAPLDLPMLADYHIDLGFDLNQPDAPHSGHAHGAGGAVAVAALRGQVDAGDYALSAALEAGLALTPRPFAELGARCGLAETEVLARIQRLLELGVIRRFGVVVRHRELGFTANAMVVWDIPDAEVERVGHQLATQAGVTLCYQRPRRLPDWPYNLFSMLHGQDRGKVLARLAEIRHELGLEQVACQPLFSRRRFKQQGARYASLALAA